ncbi:MAG: NUDIX hydrolase [Gammaproteobacteria bacterium]|nr:NUDIX hydrolase [Gammaproteobacteria bacterium]
MHRFKLLNLLEVYERTYPEESDTVQRFEEFARNHERCFERDCWAGHVTGSAWLVNASASHVLLTHHRKLDKWLQLGGHSDGDCDPLAVALREAEEESGLAVLVLQTEVFDLDIHEIPARNADPAHFHFDLRFALQTRTSDDYRVSHESHALQWVAVADISHYTREPSMLRMAEKWRRLPRSR